MSEDGDCFEANTLKFIEEFKSSKTAVLCHGIVTGAKYSEVSGQQFIHCWIEEDNVLYDWSNGNFVEIPLELVYSKGRIIIGTVKRYTLKDIAKLLLTYKHYGPFTEEELNGVDVK